MPQMKSVQSDSLDALLACPKCHGSLTRVGQTPAAAVTSSATASQSPTGFVCESCKLFFAIEDELPNMLLDDAKPWPLTSATAS
jgi:uncharacterized protein YbaR (Trm112 family)